ncbi:hypothetical protein RQP46_000192 [Phenoliferia psychrophenolica]
MAPTHTFAPLPSPQADNAAAITKLFADGGPGTTVLLLPSTLYNLVTVINFSHPYTTLATVGYPTFETGQQAVLETRGDKESTAVFMLNLSGSALKRVHIRGCRGWGRRKPESKEEEERLRREGRLGWVEGGGALVLMGGQQSEDSLIEGCRLEDPRGWTAVHVCDYSNRPKVLNNIVGPCGQEASGGPWADGLSVAGKDSLISGNTVFDATDGAIVVFCAPGSTISDNTIIARSRDLLGAINMVDTFPFDRDFTNTRVVGNVIRTEGDAYIRLGIGCGMTCWAPFEPGHMGAQNYGGHVLHNFLGPGTLGYGIALSSAKDFTVQGNAVLPGTSFSGDTDRVPWNAPPTAFITEWSDRGRTPGCNIQEGFLEGEVSYLIGTESGVGSRLTYEGGQLALDVEGRSASGEGGIRLRGARWEVGQRGELLMREEKEKSQVGTGKVLWTSGSGGIEGSNPVLKFSMAGQLSIAGADGTTFWDPTAYLRPHLDVLAQLGPRKPKVPKDHLEHPNVAFAVSEPLLTIRDSEGNIQYATSYEYAHGQWELRGGQWISIAPTDLRGVVHGLADGPATPGPPPLPTSSRPHHFSSFVKGLASDINDMRTSSSAPPAIPPRLSPVGNPCPSQPTFLYMDPHTAQLFLHSSPSPTHPVPEHTHWVAPENPSVVDDAWFVFQGDGNGVLYARAGDNVTVPWATATNGEKPPVKIVLKGLGEKDGPAFEMWNEAGERVFTSKR